MQSLLSPGRSPAGDAGWQSSQGRAAEWCHPCPALPSECRTCTSPLCTRVPGHTFLLCSFFSSTKAGFCLFYWLLGFWVFLEESLFICLFCLNPEALFSGKVNVLRSQKTPSCWFLRPFFLRHSFHSFWTYPWTNLSATSTTSEQ